MQSKLLADIYGLNSTPGYDPSEYAAIWKKDQTRLASGLTKLQSNYVYPTTYGIEVEIENVNPNTNSLPCLGPMWQAVTDGSLRDNGIELVSVPLRPSGINNALAYLNAFFLAAPDSRYSHRCSIHVHLGIANLTQDQLEILIALYLSVENAIFSVMFPDRMGNPFCFPLRDGDITAEFTRQQQNLQEDVCKYAALNLYHIRDYGTIEFRHHHGTKDIAALQKWLILLGELYTTAATSSKKSVIKALSEVNNTSSYAEFILGIMPSWFGSVDRRMMYNGITASKHFLFGERDPCVD